MNWSIINARKNDQRDNPDTGLDLSKYEIKKPKKLNPLYELRKEIATLTGKPLMQMMNQTKGFSEQQLKAILVDAKNDAIKFKINVGARIWNIIREVRETNKKHANSTR